MITNLSRAAFSVFRQVFGLCFVLFGNDPW